MHASNFNYKYFNDEAKAIREILARFQAIKVPPAAKHPLGHSDTTFVEPISVFCAKPAVATAEVSLFLRVVV
jgi:hypothetical protein